MKLQFILVVVCSLNVLFMRGVQAEQNIVPGDSIDKVYRELGTPRMEFPLRGLLVQHYDQCVVKSLDGTVVSVVQNNESGPSKKRATKVADDSKTLPIDKVLALAEQGDAESQYFIAYWNQTGESIPKNMEKAVEWYLKAAYQGFVAAQHNLGVLYMTGEGVEKDLEQAYAWALMAAENGNDTLKKALDPSLTQEQKRAASMRKDKIRNTANRSVSEQGNPSAAVVDSFTVSD